MNKSYIIVIITLVILFLLVLTNPDSVVHKAKVKEHILKDTELLSEHNNQSGWDILGATIGLSLVDKLIDTAISVDNYVVFSLTRATWENEEKIIGIGVLGNVFFIKKISEDKSQFAPRSTYQSNKNSKEESRKIKSPHFNPRQRVTTIEGNGDKRTKTFTLEKGSVRIKMNVVCEKDKICRFSLNSHGEELSDAHLTFFSDWNQSFSDHETSKYLDVHYLIDDEYYLKVDAPDNADWNIEISQ